MVLEAIGPVRETSMFSWIRRGRRSFFDVYRLKPEFQQRIPEMVAAGRRFLGRPYDIRYELDDEKIYCSELIWKAYREAGGGEMGSLTKFGDLDWQPYESVILRDRRPRSPRTRHDHSVRTRRRPTTREGLLLPPTRPLSPPGRERGVGCCLPYVFSEQRSDQTSSSSLVLDPNRFSRTRTRTRTKREG